MPNQIIPISDLSSSGVVIDTPPVTLGPNVFSDARNVRFKDGAVRKIEGEVLLNDVTRWQNTFFRVSNVDGAVVTIRGGRPGINNDASDVITQNVTRLFSKNTVGESYVTRTEDLAANLDSVPTGVVSTVGSTGFVTLTFASAAVASRFALNDTVFADTLDFGAAARLGETRYLSFWNNPNLAPLGGYYIYALDYIVDDIIVGAKVYIQNEEGDLHDITPTIAVNPRTSASGETFNGGFTSGIWQSAIFAGGFSFILNNGTQQPYYIFDSVDNTDITNVQLNPLPGWESYNVFQTILNDTFDSNNHSFVFDTGQKIDYDVNQVRILVTPAGGAQTPTIFNTDTRPDSDADPYHGEDLDGNPSTSRFTVLTDGVTDTTVITFNSTDLPDGSTVEVVIRSKDPVQVRAGVVRSFGDLLVAGNLTEVNSNEVVVRRLAGVVRTSDVAAPGQIPNNWNPFSTGASTADEFTLSDTNTVIDMRQLQGNLYIYTNSSIHVMRVTGNSAAPVTFQPVTDQYGLLTSDALVEYDGRHFVVGSNDIYIFEGHPGSIQSVSDGRVRQYFLDNVNPIHEENIFVLLNKAVDEIWVCFPTLSSVGGELNEALIWNYRDNTWTIRELNDVVAGDVAPIRGGGIPSATIVLSGTSGNAGYVETGAYHRELFTITDTAVAEHDGIAQQHEFLFADSAFNGFTARALEELTFTFDGASGPVIENTQFNVDFGAGNVFRAYDTAHGGVTVEFTLTNNIPDTGDNDGILENPVSISIDGTDLVLDNLQITNGTNLAEAIAGAIDNNIIVGLEDFRATSSGTVLTLTSNVAGTRVPSTVLVTPRIGVRETISANVTATGNGITFTPNVSQLAAVTSVNLQNGGSSGGSGNTSWSGADAILTLEPGNYYNLSYDVEFFQGGSARQDPDGSGGIFDSTNGGVRWYRTGTNTQVASQASGSSGNFNDVAYFHMADTNGVSLPHATNPDLRFSGWSNAGQQSVNFGTEEGARASGWSGESHNGFERSITYVRSNVARLLYGGTAFPTPGPVISGRHPIDNSFQVSEGSLRRTLTIAGTVTQTTRIRFAAAFDQQNAGIRGSAPNQAPQFNAGTSTSATSWTVTNNRGTDFGFRRNLFNVRLPGGAEVAEIPYGTTAMTSSVPGNVSTGVWSADVNLVSGIENADTANYLSRNITPSVTTTGNGVYSISEDDSPATRLHFHLRASSDGSIPELSTFIQVAEGRSGNVSLIQDIIPKLQAVTEYSGVDPTIPDSAGRLPTQPTGAQFFVHPFNAADPVLRIQHVGGDVEDGDFTISADTIVNGVTYDETRFGGTITDGMVMHVVQGTTSETEPPVIEVAHTALGAANPTRIRTVLFGAHPTAAHVANAVQVALQESPLYSSVTRTDDRFTTTRSSAIGMPSSDGIIANGVFEADPIWTIVNDSSSAFPDGYAPTINLVREGFQASSTPPTIRITAPTGLSADFRLSNLVGSTTDGDDTITPRILETAMVGYINSANGAGEAFEGYAAYDNTLTNDIMNMTSLVREPRVGRWSYSIVDYGTTGTTTDMLQGIAVATSVNEGSVPTYAQPTRVTVTLNTGELKDDGTPETSTLFDEVYGEGPGRLEGDDPITFPRTIEYLDPTDGVTLIERTWANRDEYLETFWDPDLMIRSEGQVGGTPPVQTELTKPNGAGVPLSPALRDIFNRARGNRRLSTLIEPADAELESTGIEPVSVTISTNQFSSAASFVSRVDVAEEQFPRTETTVDDLPRDTLGPVTDIIGDIGNGIYVFRNDPIIDGSSELPSDGYQNNSHAAVTNESGTADGTSVTTIFDQDRPWASDRLNPNKQFPIFSQSFVNVDNTDLDNTVTSFANNMIAADVGYHFYTQNTTDSLTDVAPTTYTSYVQRHTLGLTPEFDTETLASMSLWADGAATTIEGEVISQAVLTVRAVGSNTPGVRPAIMPALPNQFNVGGEDADYKTDLRVHGRFVNFRIDDTDNTLTNSPWNISGLQLDIMKGGKR